MPLSITAGRRTPLIENGRQASSSEELKGLGEVLWLSVSIQTSRQSMHRTN